MRTTAVTSPANEWDDSPRAFRETGSGSVLTSTMSARVLLPLFNPFTGKDLIPPGPYEFIWCFYIIKYGLSTRSYKAHMNLYGVLILGINIKYGLSFVSLGSKVAYTGER